ncbi:unnamed protein product [Adineta ricciae]|uniref:Uncharacterized protein n=1 Tax=Adineta ricciae TaxID=249248 RepID=A0A815AZ99_ADIRI|nr:unnamed protein product [Adineta ricciae]CAF1631099.1 unnamed protein product [Adineta ricciae]
MRTRSQDLVDKRKPQEERLANQTTTKRKKKTKALPAEDHPESVPVEKRLRCYRSKPTSAMCTRIKRAIRERLYLLAVSSTLEEPTRRTYQVFGQTGNVYTVTISRLLSCTCPDHASGNVCKHIIFILHRVLKVDSRSRLLYQRALLTNELNEIFANADAQQNAIFNDSNILAEQEVRKAYQVTTGDSNTILDTVADATVPETVVKQKTITADDDCPICCESMEDKAGDPANILFCSTSCGNNMHNNCFNQWRRMKTLMREPVTCPFCRIEWKITTDNTSSGPNVSYTADGFLNLAAHSTTTVRRSSPPPYSFNYRRYRRYYRR